MDGWSGGEVIIMLAQLGWDSELGKNAELAMACVK